LDRPSRIVEGVGACQSSRSARACGCEPRIRPSETSHWIGSGMGHRGAGALPTTTQEQIAPAAAAARGALSTTIKGPSVVSPSVDGPDFPIRRSDTTPRHPPAGSAPVADVRSARASPTARQGQVPRALQDDAAPVVRRPWIRGEPLAVGASFHGTCVADLGAVDCPAIVHA
jgi:hypothetical protein